MTLTEVDKVTIVELHGKNISNKFVCQYCLADKPPALVISSSILMFQQPFAKLTGMLLGCFNLPFLY